MLSKFKIFLLSLAALAVAVPAFAASGWTTYTPDSFASAQASGKTILVDVHADWCPTCRAQQPTLEKLRADKRFAGVMFVKVDFDKDKGFLSAHRIPRQSTIVVFQGRKETARSVAETRPDKLSAAILAGI